MDYNRFKQLWETHVTEKYNFPMIRESEISKELEDALIAASEGNFKAFEEMEIELEHKLLS